ncbi:MAG: GNAT family acetyltransferase [Lachnospiraceae bacterium]|nr:GNAT family acetyltransferase [Lachnospiraceae bacterium]
MSSYKAVNILDMIEVVGEDGIRSVLSDFSCPKNGEIENFIKKNAIEFAKKKMSITHLVMDEKGELAAIFTLTHKAVKIQDDILSSAQRRKIRRYAQLDEVSNSYLVSAFLIAQLGKNYAERESEPVSGNSLLDNAMDILTAVQRDVGGGVVYLECEDKPQLLSFYQNDNNCFRVFGERYSDTDETRYIQLLRFF